MMANSKIIHLVASATCCFIPVPRWFDIVDFIEKVIKMGKQVSCDRSVWDDGGTIYVMLDEKIIEYQIVKDSVSVSVRDEDGNYDSFDDPILSIESALKVIADNE
jgi:hypothetical protein